MSEFTLREMGPMLAMFGGMDMPGEMRTPGVEDGALRERKAVRVHRLDERVLYGREIGCGATSCVRVCIW